MDYAPASAGAAAGAASSVLGFRLQLLERFERGLDDVVRVGRAERLRQDVLDPGRLQDGPDRTPGDDACAFAGRLEQHLAGTVVAEHRVRDGRAAGGDLDHVLLGDLDALLDGGRNFLGLAGAVADFAFAVANDD